MPVQGYTFTFAFYVAVNCNQESNGLFKRRHGMKVRSFEVIFRKPTAKTLLKLGYLNDDLFANRISLSALLQGISNNRKYK